MSRIIKNSKTEEQVNRGGLGGRKVKGKLKLEALNVESKGNQE